MLKDLVSALILLLIAIAYYAVARTINQSALADEIGAAGLPILYATLLGALGLALGAKALLGWRVSRSVNAHSVHTVNELRGEARKLLHASPMLGIGIGYLVVVGFAGYLVSLTAVLALVALYQGERASWRLAGITLGGALAFWMFFVRVLGVDMPPGFWPLLWGG